MKNGCDLGSLTIVKRLVVLLGSSNKVVCNVCCVVIVWSLVVLALELDDAMEVIHEEESREY